MKDRSRPSERVLCYLGPSLPLDKARAILPSAIYRPPARQGDIVSDVVNYTPTHIILIDGVFKENLSPWHKEVVFALQYPYVKGICGAASMGALRASELDFLGMVGMGTIYEWYRDGVTEDDAEVALSYAERMGAEGPIYYPTTVPLCDIRAGMLYYQSEFTDQPIAAEVRRFFEEVAKIHYTERTKAVCERTWDQKFGVSFPHVAQKEIDAIHALSDFREARTEAKVKPKPDNLTNYFHALYDRDRKINIGGQLIPQQHIDSYCLLHNPEWERICWDSANQELALVLCNALCVTLTMEEIERENLRYQQRCGVENQNDFERMLANNGWSRAEYDRLMIQNARIHKLQHSLTVSKSYRRNTSAIIDYLRTHLAFDYWAKEASLAEKQMAQAGVDDWVGISLDKNAFDLLAEHFEKEGLELKSNQEEYLLETGFSNGNELMVALSRLKARKEQDGN